MITKEDWMKSKVIPEAIARLQLFKKDLGLPVGYFEAIFREYIAEISQHAGDMLAGLRGASSIAKDSTAQKLLAPATKYYQKVVEAFSLAQNSLSLPKEKIYEKIPELIRLLTEAQALENQFLGKWYKWRETISQEVYNRYYQGSFKAR
jgi:hypothetical protein